MGKESACNTGNARDGGFNPGWEDPLSRIFQYSCLEHSLDRGDWQDHLYRGAYLYSISAHPTMLECCRRIESHLGHLHLLQFCYFFNYLKFTSPSSYLIDYQSVLLYVLQSLPFSLGIDPISLPPLLGSHIIEPQATFPGQPNRILHDSYMSCVSSFVLFHFFPLMTTRSLESFQNHGP